MANKYTVEATVRRSDHIRKIKWDFSGKGGGTTSGNFWRKMRETHRTGDTDEPFMSAALLRNGEVVESIGR